MSLHKASLLAISLIKESVGMQFRLESFNVFNHTNFQDIDTNLFSNAFGSVVGVHNPHIPQLGLKLSF